jgi:hypothetical protein
VGKYRTAGPSPCNPLVIGTGPEQALETMRECADLGIDHVWMRSPAFGGGRVSHEAATFAREHGIRAIEGDYPAANVVVDGEDTRPSERFRALASAVSRMPVSDTGATIEAGDS